MAHRPRLLSQPAAVVALLPLLVATGGEALGNQEEHSKMTRETIQGYFDALTRREGWEDFLAEGMEFTSFTSPVKVVHGKGQYLETTRRFYSSIVTLQLRELLVDGDRACALTRYELRSPAGPPFTTDVAELFTVTDGKIASFAIYFDSAPFPK